MKVVVVGGGVAGLMAAWAFSSRGVKTLLARIRGALTASTISAGIITPLMPPPFTSLAKKSLELYTSTELKRASEHVDILWVASKGRCYTAIKKYLVSEGFNVKKVAEGPSDLVHGSLRIVVKDGEEANIVPSAIVDTGKLESVVYSHGVDIIESESGIKVECGRVVVNGYSFNADLIVAAMGPWTPLPPSLRDAATIYLCELIVIRRDHGGLEVLIDDSLDFYLVGRGPEVLAGNGLYRRLSRSELETPSPEPESHGKVLDAIMARIPRASSWQFYKVLTAPCISCLDTAPILGPHPDCDRILLFTGLDGIGVTLAPALADILARSVLEGYRIPPFLLPSRKVVDRGVRPPEPFRICEPL